MPITAMHDANWFTCIALYVLYVCGLASCLSII